MKEHLPIYFSHHMAKKSCFHCRLPLTGSAPIKSGYAAGTGAWQVECSQCRSIKFYDLTENGKKPTLKDSDLVGDVFIWQSIAFRILRDDLNWTDADLVCFKNKCNADSGINRWNTIKEYFNVVES